MTFVEIDGTPVEYESSGVGDPVVLLHARPFVRWYDPLVAALDGHLVLRCRRPVPLDAELTIEGDARLAGALLRHLGIERPHVVGHSYGGLVALALATSVDVRSVAVLEPATAGLVDPATAAERFAGLLHLAHNAGSETAMRAVLTAVCGEGAESELDRAVPGATAEAIAHAQGFFGAELPAVIAYDLASTGVAGITAPMLNVTGTSSAPRFAESASIIQSWFPSATRCEIAGANHLMMAQHPAAVAASLQSWWREH